MLPWLDIQRMAADGSAALALRCGCQPEDLSGFMVCLMMAASQYPEPHHSSLADSDRDELEPARAVERGQHRARPLIVEFMACTLDIDPFARAQIREFPLAGRAATLADALAVLELEP